MKGKLKLFLVLFILALAVGAGVAVKDEHIFLRLYRNLVSEETWFKDYQVISHALGGIDGKDYTNSFEALEYSYDRGQRVVEADFRFTKDGVLVCRHDWKDDLGQETISENAIDLETFKNTPIFGQYTPMTAEELIIYMSKHKDLYLVTDVKHRLKSATLEESMKEFVELAKKIDSSILKRVIVQIYCEEDYEKMERIYPFESYIFTLYKNPEAYKNQYDKVASFCREKGISVVTMPAKWVEGSENIAPLLERDIQIYVHTVNDIDSVAKLIKWGVTGIYTDYLYESDIKALEYSK